MLARQQEPGSLDDHQEAREVVGRDRERRCGRPSRQGTGPLRSERAEEEEEGEARQKRVERMAGLLRIPEKRALDGDDRREQQPGALPRSSLPIA